MGRAFELKSLASLNSLLLFGVIAVLLRASGGDDVAIFATSALAIIPLAGLIGQATEEIAARVGPRIGGLLNATLGNAAELIITIFALKEGLLELVRASIIGSVLGNLLLVMGLAIFLGGLRHGIQTFDRRQAAMSGTLLILAFMALAIPSLFEHTFVESQEFESELLLSEGIALILVALIVPFFLPGAGKQAGVDPDSNLPWQIAADGQGGSTVFGLQPGVSTLGEVRRRLGAELEVRAGLVVDKLVGKFQTVIKPMGKVFGDMHWLSGCTIMGTGEVAYILDVPRMILTIESLVEREGAPV